MKPPDHWIIWGVRIAALWVFAGALAKTLTGLPGDLPSPVLQLNIDPLLVIVIAVAVESFTALLALLSPRHGSIPLAALLATFAVILIMHIRSGAESCGCFGGALPMPGWVMLAFDALFLAFAAAGAARARKFAAQRRISLAIAVIAFISIALAMIAESRLTAWQPREAVRARTPSIANLLPTAPHAIWKLPTEFPKQVLLRPLQWIGKPLASTELGRWADTSKFPPDCTVLIYYLSCNHCAAHLKELARLQAVDPSKAPAYVMVQLPTPAGYTGRMFVQELPTGLRVELPSEVGAWVITPPWDVFVSAGAVVRAQSVDREPF